MASVVKQRLVGALVLLALGVVFWPIIFVAPSPTVSVAVDPVPPPPEVTTGPIEEEDIPRERISAALPKLPEQREAQAAADAATTLVDEASDELLRVDGLPTADSVVTPAATVARESAPTVDEEGLAVGWVLQVATVSSKARADMLVARLGEKGYKAFMKPIRRDQRTLYRVQIGPKAERARLAPIKQVIDQELAVDSAVLRYVQ